MPSNTGEPNWSNQTIWTGDNLDIMRGMNSACVDLIYLDPPFNSKHNYAAPIGSKAAGAAFKDTWGLDDVNLAWHGEIAHEHPGLYALLQATRQIHGDSMMAYLIYMAIRLREMRRLLKPTGAIYLHCDPTASHYLKLLMDSLFGARAFRNEIVWRYKKYQKAEMRHFTRNSDRVLFYASSSEADSLFSPVFQKLKKPKRYLRRVWDKETKRIVNAKDDDGRVQYMTVDQEKIDDVWNIPYLMPASKERLGYPTQKPLALVRRIVQASSREGDMILDPFCGCATACIAAELEHRQWAGIDISAKAADLVQDRMQREVQLFYRGAHRTDIPARTDLGNVILYSDLRNRRYLYGEQGGFCHGCQEHFLPRNMTVDHIIPRSKGGTDHISNLQLLCAACNSLKGDRPQEYLLACLTDKGWIKRRKAA